MNLVIDIGNTDIKLAVFDDSIIQKKNSTTVDNFDRDLEKIKKGYPLTNCIISSVSNSKAIVRAILQNFDKLVELNHQTKVPFINKYNTPQTLGVDRIALASAAIEQYPGQNVLILDAGTCITYDFVNSKKEYLGGAISPGITIRYKALHKYTANLPKLKKNGFSLLGTDTESSIHSGVLNGVIQEIFGVIQQYKAKYPTLTVVLTGGDANFLAKKLKSSIFANPNFLLEGLNSILIHNIDE